MTTTEVRTAEANLRDQLIIQHLQGHITIQGIIGEAFRQGVMHGEAKSATSEMRDALNYALECLTRSDEVDVVYRVEAVSKIKAAIRSAQ